MDRPPTPSGEGAFGDEEPAPDETATGARDAAAGGPEQPEEPVGRRGAPPPIGWQQAVQSLAELARVIASTASDPAVAGAFDGSRDQRAAGDQAATGHDGCLEWCPICRAADAMRAANEPGTREALGELQQEALMTARTVLDHYLQPPDPGEPDVESPS